MNKEVIHFAIIPGDLLCRPFGKYKGEYYTTFPSRKHIVTCWECLRELEKIKDSHQFKADGKTLDI